MKTKTEKMNEKVLSQLTDEYLLDLASDVINNGHLQFYLVIDDDGEIYDTYSPAGTYEWRRRGNKEIEQVTLPCYQYVREDEIEFCEERNLLAEDIKSRVLEAINEIPDDYWE